MASKYFRGARTTMDVSRAFINIDVLCDAYTKVQKDMGKQPTFKEKESQEEIEEETPKTCDRCNKSCENKNTDKKKIDFSIHGLYADAPDDEEDSEYICEWCDALGYKRKYKPEVCDNCSRCESCQEYDDEECSGCSYSRFRDGSYYRDKLSDEDLFSKEDLDILGEIKLDKKGGQRFESDRFSVTKM